MAGGTPSIERLWVEAGFEPNTAQRQAILHTDSRPNTRGITDAVAVIKRRGCSVDETCSPVAAKAGSAEWPEGIKARTRLEGSGPGSRRMCAPAAGIRAR